MAEVALQLWSTIEADIAVDVERLFGPGPEALRETQRRLAELNHTLRETEQWLRTYGPRQG